MNVRLNSLWPFVCCLFCCLLEAEATRVGNGLRRMRAASVAQSQGMRATTAEDSSPVSSQAALLAQFPFQKDKNAAKKRLRDKMAAKYEIRSVAGEPNYKSVNLTWEVEFVRAEQSTTGTSAEPAAMGAITVTNRTAEIEPSKVFQILFCELQSFGSHRCRSKLVNGTRTQRERAPHTAHARADNSSSRQLYHYAANIDNLRMATTYSFHIRPQLRRRHMRIAGASEMLDYDIDNELGAGSEALRHAGQTITMPTKGFSAEATKCLPNASEIEVQTGPHFAGEIVVDGGKCGMKGDPESAAETYTMRIDHSTCGSLVKPETNTVETFITVQENLGIYTHSTRRFVVVCSFQSGMQTVRASFNVPGRGGVAAPVANDPFVPDDREGRKQQSMRYVDRSALITKEPSGAADAAALLSPAATQLAVASEEARVRETTERLPTMNETRKDILEILPNTTARQIQQGAEEVREVALPLQGPQQTNHRAAKRLVDHATHDSGRAWYAPWGGAGEGRAHRSALSYLAGHMDNIVLVVLMSVIILIFVIAIAYMKQQRRPNRNSYLPQH